MRRARTRGREPRAARARRSGDRHRTDARHRERDGEQGERPPARFGGDHVDARQVDVLREALLVRAGLRFQVAKPPNPRPAALLARGRRKLLFLRLDLGAQGLGPGPAVQLGLRLAEPRETADGLVRGDELLAVDLQLRLHLGERGSRGRHGGLIRGETRQLGLAALDVGPQARHFLRGRLERTGQARILGIDRPNGVLERAHPQGETAVSRAHRGHQAIPQRRIVTSEVGELALPDRRP